MIFESASFSSLLKLFQSQENRFPKTRCTIIEKHSRQLKGSRRMASRYVPFIHLGVLYLQLFMKVTVLSMRVMVLTKDWITGFWTRTWWISWQVWSLLRVILENSCLRLGRRNEEETSAHCLSKCVSSPTAAITLSMISCGISIAFAICAFVVLGWLTKFSYTGMVMLVKSCDIRRRL